MEATKSKSLEAFEVVDGEIWADDFFVDQVGNLHQAHSFSDANTIVDKDGGYFIKGDCKKVAPAIQVVIPFVISHEKIQGWIISALEGGSNYWYWIPTEEHTKVDKSSMQCFSERFADAVLNHGQSIEVWDLEDEEKVGEINLQSVKDAVIKIAQAPKDKHGWAFKDLLNDYDATSADIFFQFAVMGEVRYC